MPTKTAACLLLAASVAAQVPDGHYVVSSLTVTLNGPGVRGGLFLVDPRIPGPGIPITGLPTDLRPPPWGLPGDVAGANCVRIRQSDGALLVGDKSGAGTNSVAELHILELCGSATASHRSIPIGSHSVDALECLPGGDVIVGGNFSPTSGLARVSPSTGQVTHIPLSPPLTRPLQALTVDPTGTTVYFASREPCPPCVTGIYGVPISGGTPQLLAQAGVVEALEYYSDGRIYIAEWDTTGTRISWLDPSTGQTGLVGSVSRFPTGLAMERATGAVVFPSATPSGVFLMSLGGAIAQLVDYVPGCASGIAVLNNPRTYGQDTPVQNRYLWQTEPNPGGIPRIGNASFGLQLKATPSGNASGVLLASTAPGSTTILGVELLLATPGILHVGQVPASGSIPLPIPNSSALFGASLFFQSLHVQPGGLAASNGFRMTVLR